MTAVSEAESHTDGIVWVPPTRYTPYLTLLGTACGRLLEYYREVEKQANSAEAESMALYVQKIIASVRSLRLKHAFSPVHFQRPGVDLADSGFPHFYDVIEMDSDLAARDERLSKLPELEQSKEMLLDYLMQPGTESPVRESEVYRRLQWQYAERAYFESLDLRKQFFRFTPGRLTAADHDPSVSARRLHGQNRHAHQFSWGCYDAPRNRPCVYFMHVEQDGDEKPLGAPDNPEYARFLQTIESVACRAPEELAPIAVRLDMAFRGLYPKALKRICLGPLVSPLLWDGEATAHSELARELKPLFTEAALSADDFVLFFSTEMVVSVREEKPAGLRSALGFEKAKQIFGVPRDREHRRRGASAFQDYCILPHRLRQHLSQEVRARIPEFRDPNLVMLAYNTAEKGVANVG